MVQLDAHTETFAIFKHNKLSHNQCALWTIIIIFIFNWIFFLNFFLCPGPDIIKIFSIYYDMRICLINEELAYIEGAYCLI